jgi:hypothetical protein
MVNSVTRKQKQQITMLRFQNYNLNLNLTMTHFSLESYRPGIRLPEGKVLLSIAQGVRGRGRFSTQRR